MARERSTPYSAQLKRFLANPPKGHSTFSAVTLESVFTHPQHQKQSTRLSGIHKALIKAYADGQIVTFLDIEGNPLREAKVAGPGSKAISRPQIYGLPGASSPDSDYQPFTYEEAMAPAEPEEAAIEDEEKVAGETEKVENSGPATKEAETPAASGLHLTPQEASDRFRAYLDRPPAAAPDWVPLAVLREWAAKPEVIVRLREVIRDGPTKDRLALIRSGLSRKGQISAESPATRGIAQLCRREGPFWGTIVRHATRQYLEDEEAIDASQLAEFACNPLAYYLEHQDSPFVLVLCAVALELDPEQVVEIAEEAEGESENSDEESEKLEDQLARKESLLADANKAIKDAEKELSAAEKRSETLATELKKARGEELSDSEHRHEEALAELSKVKAELEEAKADAERLADTEEEVRALERSRDALLSEAQSVESERRLRQEIEAQVQDQMRELTELRARQRSDQVLPVEDGPSLLKALERPLGEAARQAGERLAAARPAAADDLLLGFASTVMQTSRAMSGLGTPQLEEEPVASIEADAAQEAKPEVDVGKTPAQEEAAEQVAAEAPPADAEETSAKEELAPSADEHVAAKGEAAKPGPVEPAKRQRESWFTVRPVGGAGEIGGSAILVETRNHERVLLDAGQRVKGEYGLESAHLFHRGVRGVDHLHGILISHAHIDHVGSLPSLWNYHSTQQDAEVPIFMTPPTRELGEIMLHDSAKIQHAREYERDALGESDFGQSAMEPVYTEAEVKEVLESVTEVERYTPVPIPGTSLVARFQPVSHVLGSCAIHLTDLASGKTLLYTGDLGPISETQRTLPDFGGTELIDRADTVIIESTYGVRTDAEREGRGRAGLAGRERAISNLFGRAESAFDRGGSILMPSFSLGRTQELVRLIGDHMEGAKIYLAGMGEAIFEVYDSYQRKEGGFWVRPGPYPATEPIGRMMRGLSFEEKVEAVLEGDQGFIIASPAMLSGGWSRAFLERMIDDSRHAVMFSGYLPRHGTGIPRLRELGKNRSIEIDGRSQKIKCDWGKVGLSAHAPAGDLRQVAQELAKGRDHVEFGVVHGEPAGQRELAADIGEIQNATARSLSNGEPWVPGRG